MSRRPESPSPPHFPALPHISDPHRNDRPDGAGASEASLSEAPEGTAAERRRRAPKKLVGAKGFEPSTPRSRTESERAYLRINRRIPRGASAQKVLIEPAGWRLASVFGDVQALVD